MAGDKPAQPSCAKPSAASFQDLAMWENRQANKPPYTTCYLVTPDEEVYFCLLSKRLGDVTLEECNSALERISDDKIYPKTPEDTALTMAPPYAPQGLSTSVFIKKPGLISYDVVEGSDFIPRETLNEVFIMEQVSKLHHPNIIPYYGCVIRRGRIAGIALQRLDQTLAQYAISKPGEFHKLDKSKFVDEVQSAVDSLHAIGPAHNDINPGNIMIKDGDGGAKMPVLIDFGSCGPFGKNLQSCGSPGWFEEDFNTSERKHDEYSMGVLREWMKNPKPI
ncbi:hypothetical protein FQN54_000758 [Arachnomyces sp. PD_36]|nr:hypothetical protein FQN54_000758 [Arachnomyces sp. PD_36]